MKLFIEFLLTFLRPCKHTKRGWPVNGYMICFDCFERVPVKWNFMHEAQKKFFEEKENLDG